MEKKMIVKGVGTNQDKYSKPGPNDGKRPKTFFKKMDMRDRGQGTWGGGVGRP